MRLLSVCCLYFSPTVRMCCFTTVNGFPQPPRTGTTGAGRTSCCAQTAAFTSRSTVSCPPSRSLWTRRHLCSNLSKRKRMDSAGSIAWGPDGTEARCAHTLLLPIYPSIFTFTIASVIPGVCRARLQSNKLITRQVVQGKLWLALFQIFGLIKVLKKVWNGIVHHDLPWPCLSSTDVDSA